MSTSWVQRVRVVAVFSAAVHVALPVSTTTLTIHTAFWVGPRTHDDGGAQLGLTVLYIQTTLNISMSTDVKTKKQKQQFTAHSDAGIDIIY